jgi:hypothetical protein
MAAPGYQFPSYVISTDPYFTIAHMGDNCLACVHVENDLFAIVKQFHIVHEVQSVHIVLAFKSSLLAKEVSFLTQVFYGTALSPYGVKNACERFAWHPKQAPCAGHQWRGLLWRKVIYDNCFHLLDYMLNRDPEWAKSQRVMIDELHAKGHTSCASSFDTGVFLFGRMVMRRLPGQQ